MDGKSNHTVAEKSSSSSGGAARVSVTGWSNAHRPIMEEIIIIGRIGRTNAHRPRAPRKHSLRGWNPGGGCRAPRDGGWG